VNEDEWQEHFHEPLLHSHRHYHVTHNHREGAGGFKHLASEHEHEHRHGEVTHAHLPHVSFDEEHAGEAHVHDHEASAGHHPKRRGMALAGGAAGVIFGIGCAAANTVLRHRAREREADRKRLRKRRK